MTTVLLSRLEYYDTGDGSDVALNRVTGMTFSLNGNDTDLTRTYSMELPAAVPGEDITYYYTGWLDANGDGILDVQDASGFMNPATVITGEFTRMPIKDTENSDGDPITILVTGFQQSTIDEGLYKYIGEDDTTVYGADIDETNSSGFDFDMTADVSGW